MLDIFHPAQGAAISGTRASVLGAWRAQRREDGTSVTRRHWQQGERDQAPVYTVEATDWLLPVPGRVPAVGGRDGAMPVVTESRGKLRNCWDDSLRIRRAAWGYLREGRPIQLAVGQYKNPTAVVCAREMGCASSVDRKSDGREPEQVPPPHASTAVSTCINTEGRSLC